ncbi:MAG: hypothetical protein RTU30_06685 [Candidatus Thorarchaeota archaeon]
MGVKNWDFVPWRWASLDEIDPRCVAIDVPNYMTRRISSFSRPKRFVDRVPLHHVGVTISLVRAALSAHVLPVMVFEGPPEQLKRPPNPELVKAARVLYEQFKSSDDVYDSELAERLHHSPALRMYFAANHLRDLCSVLGIPALTAYSEAELTAAVMCREGLVGSVVSNDADALLFGSPHVSRRLQFSKNQIERAKLLELEDAIGLDLDGLRDLAIVCGCDFHPGVKGVGPRRGVILLKRHRGLDGLLRSQGYSSFEREEFIRAREVFDEGRYLSLQGIDLKLKPPLVSKAVRLLSPVTGIERAERTLDSIVRLWKDFGRVQTTLESWI